jgi:ferritin
MSTFNFLQQFIAIQTKAVAEYADKLNMLELFDQTDKNWLFNFEKKLVK